MMESLKRLGLPKEAESRGLHSLAESELAKIVVPAKATLEKVMQNQLSQSNFPRLIENVRPGYAQKNWSSPDLTQLPQTVNGMSKAAALIILVSSAFLRRTHVDLGLSDEAILPHDGPRSESSNPPIGDHETLSSLPRDMIQRSNQVEVAETPTQNRPGLILMPRGQPPNFETRTSSESTGYAENNNFYPNQMEISPLYQNDLEVSERY